ncbi:hypothetical protein SAMN05444395_102519 [Flavobacterium fryxellicola]|uniref:Phage infection protein n=1 Tax=Flavobacterium fryxellicola TaxID=249352 RepID=A0A167XX85_9FLAO|nr:hypothetical protein [Flavobacterium fryxellicola]OAB28783.1 hypothetical protein FBFR_04745 [Flavobacterium fryxellicola]SHN61765.1 hypothetical protein SAMN05444395_102519 [Flavobacterium fryxellicola]
MDKLSIKLENCFGIEKLEQEFDFSKCRAVAIYAPNGMMKTSFAKTFEAKSLNKEPSENLYNKIPFAEIMTDGNLIDMNEIVVINSFATINTDKSVSTLLVDENSKIEYDEIFTDISKQKTSLIAKLNKLSGIKQTDIEQTILSDFNDIDFFKFLSEIDFENIEDEFSDIKLNEVFETDVLAFLKKPDVINNINIYTEKYNQLLETSKYFKKGIFNPSKADSIAKILSKENFFKANHKIRLHGDDDEIVDDEAFKNKLSEERKDILGNHELIKIENEIKKASVIRFREILEEFELIIPELNDLVLFKKKLWGSYFTKEKAFIEELILKFSDGKQRLGEIEELANSQRTSWEDVIGKFEERFFVPFKATITNKSSVVLGKSAPTIVFLFEDLNTDKKREIKKEDIEGVNVLSQGEKRALYILNLMFNIEARKKENKKTLFIIDDIADSFDYKNKYAIIQYLKDISEEPLFYQIILTHNFDFFRSVENRNIASYKNLFLTYKSVDGIKLDQAKGIKNPFINDWKENLNNPKKLIASITFVRNIIEYTKGEDDNDYLTLTYILHWRIESQTIYVSNLKYIFENIFPGINFNTDLDLTDKVVDVIFNEAENCLVAAEGINLENKLILSIAIRLYAEKYMWSRVSNQEVINGSTGKLFARFKKEFKGILDNEINILDEVNLITPENIHLNSFMFEPILDLSDLHLKNLYNRIKTLQ